MADTQRALTAIGNDLRRQLQPAIHDFFHGELATLPELMESGGGRGRLRSAAANLVMAVRRPQSAQAAWRDLVDAVDGGASIDAARHLALILREVDTSLGHEWRWRESRLRQLAGEGSLADCEEILGDPPSRTAQVAWFVFADADVPSTAAFMRVGQVQFFSHRLWPDTVRNRDYISQMPNSEFPAELDDDAVQRWFGIRDSSEAHVFARVELTGPRAEPLRTPWAHGRPPADWARELVVALVEAGTFRIGGSAWRLLEGEAVYHGTISDESGTFGNWSGTRGFVDSSIYERIRRFRHPLREGTGEALEELNPRVAELIAESDQSAMHAVEEVRWYQAARNQPDPAQRVVLHVRAFERALPVDRNFRWNDALKQYLREQWAIDEFDDGLFRLAHTAHREMQKHANAELDRMEQWLIDETGDRFTIALGAFLREASNIGPHLPRSLRLERRRVREVATWVADPVEVRRRIGCWEQRFSQLLSRAVRQRNAVVHGITTVPDVVASVDPFVARMAGYIVAKAVHGVGERSQLIDALEQSRARSRRVLWRLEQRDGAVDQILYHAEGM